MGVVRMVLYSWECSACNRTGTDFWAKKDAAADFAAHLQEPHPSVDRGGAQ